MVVAFLLMARPTAATIAPPEESWPRIPVSENRASCPTI
jgi:hypothetical protein